MADNTEQPRTNIGYGFKYDANTGSKQVQGDHPPAYWDIEMQQNRNYGQTYPNYPPEDYPGAVTNYRGYPNSNMPQSNLGYSPDYPSSEGGSFPVGTSVAYPEGSAIENATPMESEDPDDRMTVFSDATIRKGFIRKVFVILFSQLVVTFGIMAIFIFSKDARKLMSSSPYILLAAFIVYFISAIVLICCGNARRTFPANFICLGIFTLATSWMLAAVACVLNADDVLIAVGMCMGVTFIMFLLGLQTKYDFTYWIGPLVSVLFCLIMLGFMSIWLHSRFLQMLYATIGAILFSIFITVDVQLVVGKGRFALDPEEYIFAALNIYLDIVNLLMMIFRIFGSSK